ncbi:MAG TPA: M20 family metallo-hydrolase [Caldilineae bacterium]|nr:M20 family metallo-hydrolase [Caldilineae bacterium]
MLKINATRLLANLESLAQIGGTPIGGVSRPAFSEADVAGRAWFKIRVEEAGLAFQIDGAGNLSAILPSTNPLAPTLLFGSHLDSVPNGGRFDGSLGVLCALEALQTIQEAKLALPCHLEAISFTDEEGAALGTFGSRAFVGDLDLQDLQLGRLTPQQLDAGLQRLGLTRTGFLSAQRPADTLAGFIEVHIEQGTRLEKAGVDIGVVTAIVGIRSFWLRFIGQAAHAGTMPMSQRADALWGAAEFIRQAREMVAASFSPGVMNCGRIQVSPGSFNIVPGEARLALEFRHSTVARLDEMEAALLDLAAKTAGALGLQCEAEPLARSSPAQMDGRMMQVVEKTAGQLGLSHIRLPSLAGHDARSLSRITPTALIFTPSVAGISHNPRELTHDEDVINGANVLLHAILALAAGQA